MFFFLSYELFSDGICHRKVEFLTPYLLHGHFFGSSGRKGTFTSCPSLSKRVPMHFLMSISFLDFPKPAFPAS